MNFPTIDSLVWNTRCGFIGPLPMPAYYKRMELAELNRRLPAFAAAPPAPRRTTDAVDDTTIMVVEPYVSTPIKAYDIKEEPRTPTNEDVEDAILWAVAADIEEANEVAEAVRCLNVDDSKKRFLNFLTDTVDLIPLKKRFVRALTL